MSLWALSGHRLPRRQMAERVELYAARRELIETYLPPSRQFVSVFANVTAETIGDVAVTASCVFCLTKPRQRGRYCHRHARVKYRIMDAKPEVLP